MRRAVAAAGWVVLAAGCEQPRTELVARVDSEVAWGPASRVQAVTLTVRRGDSTGPLRDVRTTVLGTDRGLQALPLLVGILPGDDTGTPVWVEALGCPAAARCARSEAVVAQRAVVRFTRGQTDVVPLLFASACVGATCGSDERCGEGGRCEPATRATVRPFDGLDAGTLADVASDAGGMDRGTVADASMTDAGAPPGRNDLGTVADAVVPVDAPAPDVLGTDTVATPDTAASCGTLELRCGGACVPVMRDPMNCGACGAVCPAVAGATPTCMGGRCGYACDAAHADCDERPSNGCEQGIASDTANCGACGRVCSVTRAVAGCSSRLCTVASCLPNYADCDGSATNGCEVDVRDSEAHLSVATIN